MSKIEGVRRRGERKYTGANSQDDILKMQGQEVSKTLPEDLVEEILARVPYPSVFKARVLSKSWLARLSPISSQEDEQKKLLAISFQQLISKRSATWKAFCPVLMSHGNLFGYDGASQTWESLPSLSFLPENLISHLSGLDLDSDMTLKIEGPLVLVSVWEEMIANPPLERYKSIWDRDIFVANILTRSWKKLPPRPSRDVRKWDYIVECECKLVTLSPDKYKVITVYDVRSIDGQIRAKLVEIYDSTSATWSTKNLSMYESSGVCRAPSYVDGMVCVQIQIFHESVRIVLLDIKEEIWRELTIWNLQTSLESPRWHDVDSVVCNGKLLICFHDNPTAYRMSRTRVMKLDLDLRQFSKVAQGPPAALLDLVGASAMDGLGTPIADGNCIYFRLYDKSLIPLYNELQRMGISEYKVVAYNVQEDEWSCLPFPEDDNIMPGYHFLDFSFRPGLNPCAEV